MTQRELQVRIAKIYIDHQKIRWMQQGEYHKEGTGAWQLAEADERTLGIEVTGKEAAKWTF